MYVLSTRNDYVVRKCKSKSREGSPQYMHMKRIIKWKRLWRSPR